MSGTPSFLCLTTQITMKKIFVFVLAFIGCTTFFSCGNKKQQQSKDNQIEEFRSQLTSEDTTSMLKLCDDAMERLKNKDIDGVISTLYEYNDSTQEVKPLSKELEKAYRRRFQLFPVLEYERHYYSFQLEGCNDVKYMVTFGTPESAGTQEAPRTAFMFNPVKIDGQWKLCVKTVGQEFDKSEI